jgi:prepilin-type N-terminal cleavage/methylation domain-containing protein
MHTRKHTFQAGFTLIETLVSTSLLVLLLMTATTLFMTFLVSNAKTNVRHTIKGEGNFALNRMEYLIRNAESLSGVTCSSGGTTNSTATIQSFGSADMFVLRQPAAQIEYAKTDLSSTEFLTSTSTTTSSLRFTCYGAAKNGNRRIEITFTLAQDVNSVQTTTPISENFRSVVQIRN